MWARGVSERQTAQVRTRAGLAARLGPRERGRKRSVGGPRSEAGPRQRVRESGGKAAAG
jgi:hypothetical protein